MNDNPPPRPTPPDIVRIREGSGAAYTVFLAFALAPLIVFAACVCSKLTEISNTLDVFQEQLVDMERRVTEVEKQREPKRSPRWLPKR
jgi:hypothetical protein